ncbi:MAG: helix-turn-helix domain-containing protein [Bacilli bacterium]
MAKILNCTQTTYSKYELESLNIHIHALKILAKYYNNSIDYIIELTDTKEPYKYKNK